MWYELIWSGIGFVAGWIVFQRPEWATDLLNRIKTKLPWSS